MDLRHKFYSFNLIANCERSGEGNVLKSPALKRISIYGRVALQRRPHSHLAASEGSGLLVICIQSQWAGEHCDLSHTEPTVYIAYCHVP